MTKETITERIRTALEVKGLKRGDFYQYANINSQSLINWDERGSMPAADTAIKMADFLNVSVRWLITGTEDPSITQEELDLLMLFRELDDQDDRAEIVAIIQLKLKKREKTDVLSSSETA
jgi:transcriptional regulator with XRE-family HTH domain